MIHHQSMFLRIKRKFQGFISKTSSQNRVFISHTKDCDNFENCRLVITKLLSAFFIAQNLIPSSTCLQISFIKKNLKIHSEKYSKLNRCANALFQFKTNSEKSKNSKKNIKGKQKIKHSRVVHQKVEVAIRFLP